MCSIYLCCKPNLYNFYHIHLDIFLYYDHMEFVVCNGKQDHKACRSYQLGTLKSIKDLNVPII